MNDYIDNGITEKKEYNIDGEQYGIIGLIHFYIEKCSFGEELYRFIRDDGTISIISRNKKEVSGWCTQANRMTGPI